MSERVSWKNSNLALIGSDLDHQIKAAAAAGEKAWEGTGKEVMTKVWRVEQFKVVEWPAEKYGKFHTGDSYIVLNSYKKSNSNALLHDVHIWIGKESSQDEYGTAAYKMVELDDYLGGAPVQHREVQGHESPMFCSYFRTLTYLDGGVESGFNHVGPTVDVPHLYKIKGTEKGMSMSQVPLSKSSLNHGDCFILFANHSMVWIWHGESSNPDEKARAISVGEEMCTEGTVSVIEASEASGDNAAFWAYLGDGEIQPSEGGDEAVHDFAPILFRIRDTGSGEPLEPEKIAVSEPIKKKWGPPVSKIDRSLLDDGDVFLLDAGWEVFLWIGKNCQKSEKLAGMTMADVYLRGHTRTVDLPLHIFKSGWENSHFNDHFA